MSRSTYIYVVTLGTGSLNNLNAAFTVKRELQSYLNRRAQVPDASDVTVWRLRDNPTRDDPVPVDITASMYATMKP
jgi:hypothetical protein